MASLSLIFFIIIVFLSQLSILGFGQITKNIINFNSFYNEKYLDKFIDFFFGIIILNIIGFLLYFFSITSFYVNLFILIFGLFIYIKNRRLESQHIEIKTFILLLIMFVGILISKTHEDYISYHFKYIDIISNSEFIMGLGNQQINFVYTPFFSYLQKIFILPIFQYKLLHIPIYLIFFNFCFFLMSDVLDKKKITLTNLLLLIFLLTKFTRLSEYGYDYPAGFLLLSIIIIFFYHNRNSEPTNPFLFLVLFIYAISIKVTSLFFLPILLVILFKSVFTNKKKMTFLYKNLRVIFFCIALLTLVILDSFFKSGCFVYFIELTCAGKELIPWSVDYSEITDFSYEVNLWAKGYYHQKAIINDPELFLKIYNWLPIWYKNYFYYKISEFVILLIFISLIIFAFNYKTLKKNKNHFNYFELILLISSFISLILWISYLPQLRFGFYSIICLYIFILKYFFEININLKNKKAFYSLIILALTIYVSYNLKRIIFEFERNDRHKFINFPFESTTNFALEKNFKNRSIIKANENIKTNEYYIFKYITK